MAVSRPKPKAPNNDESAVDKVDPRHLMEKVLVDISKASATRQMVLGTSAGWVTGQIAMRTGKVVAFIAGSGIILLQVANQTGYIKINWDKIFNRLDKVSDKVEEAVTGSGPTMVEKAERFLDRKLDKIEDKLGKGEKKVKSWYSRLVGKDRSYKLDDISTFLLSFTAGIALGIATS